MWSSRGNSVLHTSANKQMNKPAARIRKYESKVMAADSGSCFRNLDRLAKHAGH